MGGRTVSMPRHPARLDASSDRDRTAANDRVDGHASMARHPAEIRAQLGVPATARLVVGWVGPVDRRSGVVDLVEAAAICDEGVAVLIPAAGPDHSLVMDQADAFDLLHRIRFVPVAGEDGANPARSRHHACPSILAAADVIVVSSSRRRAARRQALASLAAARAQAIPVITRGIVPDPLGTARWAVRPGDPGLLARLLTELVASPALLLPTAPPVQAAKPARSLGGRRPWFTVVPGPRTLRAWLLAPGRPQTTP